jgi:hypothetical protein
MLLIGFVGIGFVGDRKSRRENFIRNCFPNDLEKRKELAGKTRKEND